MSEEHEESEEIQDDLQLNSKLKETGLDPEYWLNEIKQLGIKNINSLQYVQAEDCSGLENKIRHPWEKRALHKLFNIPDSSVRSADILEKQAQNRKETSEEALKRLEQLKVLGSEKKNPQDEVVSKNIDEIQKPLEIPTESSVPPDKTLEDLIPNFEKQISVRLEASSKTDHYTDEEVMKYSSGGLALEGIFNTKNSQDLFKKREKLICIPENVHLMGPEQTSGFSQKEFISHEEESCFRKTIEKVGVSLSGSLGFNFKGLCLGFGHDAGTSSAFEVSTNSSKDHTYVCTTKYNYVPLASYHLSKNQLRLSQDALSELKNIEKLIFMNSDKQIIRSKCEDFFERFGSHANLGPIHFGGIFWWKASMEGVHKNNLHEAKTSTSQALNDFMNCGYAEIGGKCGTKNTNTQGSVDKSKKTQLEKQIHVSVTKTGGPLEADLLPQWKAGLATSNRSWSVIDRGFQLTPVWKIILDNHKTEFKDVIKLSSCLMDSYRLVTGLSAEVLFGEHLLIACDETQLLLESVKSWDPENTKKHLSDLLKFKKKIKELTKSDSTWVNLCLSDKRLQSFLVQVAKKYEADISSDVNIIKALMQKIIEPHIYSSEDFADASVLINWIYDSGKCKFDHICEFTELTDVLQKSMDDIQLVTADLKSSTEKVQQTKVIATLNISLSLYSFLRMLRETQQTDTELLILCISKNARYCVENHNFQVLLTWRDIEFLKDQLHEAYKEYTNLRKQCAQRAQAFVLYTGLTTGGQYNEISSQQKKERLDFMIKHLGNALEPDIDNILKQSLENLELTESRLRAFSNGYGLYEEVQAQDLVKLLSRLCQEQKPCTENEDIIKASTIRKDFLAILKDLDLEKYYPQKMKTDDFHMISRTTLSGAKPLENKELPIYFLQKLLVSDYGARYVHCEDNSEESQLTMTTINDDHTVGSSLSCVHFFNMNKKVIKKLNIKHVQYIHPMDVQMAIFHCANDIMRQYLYTKLSFCQFALPLLVPDPTTRSIEFPLWAFQEVKKNWKTKKRDAPKNKKSNDKFIKKTGTPIVSFMRLGPSAFSKSQMINWLMSKHDIFYHRNCEGSTKFSVLMDGVTEIAWYCPGGRDDDAFDDCTAFVNLHGDVRDHGPQLKFLQEISSVLVIVITQSDLDDHKSISIVDNLLASSKPCVMLGVDEELSESIKHGKLKIGINDKCKADLINEVRTSIQKLLSGQKAEYSLNTCAAVARSHGFLIDEDKAPCKAGKEQAEKLLNLLEIEELSSRKNTFLPLQGNLWSQWCKKDKELNRLGKSHLSIEEQRSDIESKKEALRRDQLKRAYPLNNFMTDFLKFQYSNKCGSRMYFLQWLKMYLDELSSEDLSDLNQKYHCLWSKVKAQKQEDKEIIDTMEKQLKQISNQIKLSKFGLEHVLRELGQMYEALEANVQDQTIGNLSKIAANLMISGYPIELMDGDAAHVPLKWITAIFQELKDTLGDKRLFVISVLGIQSTGKSTLLNAMFGLRFAVSAGRCTRGAYMQLVKVEEDLRNEMNYDYVLVIDTEGLRSTELSSKNVLNHDNELATFVIGLGNLTLINIFGENPSEMQDILQIVVQAFLRMKKVNLHPGCLFVHQNVEEITAQEKNMEGQRCLQSMLDEMTVSAAQQEECDVTCFNDVIKFDVDSDIHYFPHLWEGDPPMAPINPRYSQNVQTLRKLILDLGKENNSILNISAFSARITDLWNALLNENFVFSFKNSLMAETYNQLEVRYSEWEWRLRERMLVLWNEINNQILNEEIKSIKEFPLRKNFDEVFSAVQEDLNMFFDEDKNKSILVQWRENTESRIECLKEKLIVEIRKKANELIILKEKNREIDQMKAKYKEDIYIKSKDLALTLKCKKLNDIDLKAEFNKMWNYWISAVTGDVPSVDSTKIHRDLDGILKEHFKSKVDITNMICESYKWGNLTEEFSKFVSGKKKYKVFKETLSDDTKRKITNSAKVLTKRINEYIDRKEQEKMDYQSSYFNEILNKIQNEINKIFDKKYKFLTDYIVYASLFLCRKAADRFIKLSEAFSKANDPKVYLETKREEFYMCFKVSCEGKLEVASLADIISNKLQASLQQAVYEKSAIDVSRAMKCDYPALNGNRSKLEFYLLKFLAEKENFQDYLKYFTDPKSAVKEFIGECIKDYMGDTLKMSDLLHNNVDEFMDIILDAINQSTVRVKEEKGDVDSWLDTFCSQLGNKLNLLSNDLKSVKYQNISEMDFLKEAMTRAVDTAVQKLHEGLSKPDMESLKKRILTILTDNFPGCWETCPFCGAVCTDTGSQHGTNHSVKYHRPAGLTGRWTWCFGKRLRTDICTSLVGSHALFLNVKSIPTFYRNYFKAGPPYSDWSIQPDNSPFSYWKWVTCRFQSDIEKHHRRTFQRIPEQWKQISKVQVISEIEELLSRGEASHGTGRQQRRGGPFLMALKWIKMSFPTARLLPDTWESCCHESLRYTPVPSDVTPEPMGHQEESALALTSQIERVNSNMGMENTDISN